MSTIVTRAGKGAALSWAEGDANFTNLNTDKYESGDSPSFAAVTNGGVLATGYHASISDIIGIGATPVQWDISGTTYGYQLGTNAFWVNQGNTYTQLSHGMRVNTAGNQVYTSSSASPVWLSLSGGTFYVYGAGSGLIGNTISAPTPVFSVDCTNNTVAINNNNISAENSLGFRNRIINGDMRIDQRATTVTTDNTYSVDRWIIGEGGSGAVSVARSTSTPPTGFSHFVRWTVTTADTAAASEYYYITQRIEGTNCVDFAFGSASAVSLTLSFMVRSSLTGTFGGTFLNSAANRSYPFSYTISAANTWESKTVTITGDTSGTWLTDTGIGIAVGFDMGSGSDYQGTANQWNAALDLTPPAMTSVMATLNATFDITGVQLEVGSVATPFERRPYGTELALCQRYYEKHTMGSLSYLCMAQVYSTTLAVGPVPFKVTKRAVPTAYDISAASTWAISDSAFGILNATNATSNVTTCTENVGRVDIQVASGLTTGHASVVQARSGQTATIGFSSEL